MAREVGPVVLRAVPSGAGTFTVTVGVGVTETAQVVMPAWAYHALGADAVAQMVWAQHRRTVRLLRGAQP